MSFIPEDIIARVVERTDIAALIGSYVPLKRAGKNLKACCPFHNEKTPSFVVTPQKQIFYCFGCSAGGNAVAFIMKQERLEFPEAVRFLADKLGIEIPENAADAPRDGTREKIFEANAAAAEYFHQNLVQGRESGVIAAREYIKGRRLNLDAVRRFKIGYAHEAWDGLIKHLRGKGFGDELIDRSGLVVAREDNKGSYDRFRGRVIFPIFDYRARCVAFAARALKKDDKAKYINSPETPVYTKGRHLYGFHWAKEAVGREDRVIVVEGYLDFIRPFLAGVEHVAASQGTALTPEQIRLIRRYTRNVTMLFDMDAPGQSAALRSLDALLEEEMDVKVALLAQGEDPDSFIQKYGAQDFRERIADAKSFFDFKFDRLMAEFGAQKVEGRGIICREMLATIEKVKNEVVKSGYWKELAARLNVAEDVVLRERQNMLKKQPQAPHQHPQEAIKPAMCVALSSDEEWLLRFVMADAQWLQAVRSQVDPGDIPSEQVREVLQAAYRLLDQGREAGPAALAGALQDAGLRQKLMELASTSVVMDAKTAAKAFADCLKRIRDRSRQVRRQDVRELIRQAEKTGDHEALRRAQEEFNQLLKK